MFLSSIPSITVVGLPNFRVSSLTRILCCSFSISPQTHKSLGSPHVEQTSAMTLNIKLSSAIYKSFKSDTTTFFDNCALKSRRETVFRHQKKRHHIFKELCGRESRI